MGDIGQTVAQKCCDPIYIYLIRISLAAMFRMTLNVSRTKTRRHIGNLHPLGDNSDLNQDGNSGRCEKNLHSRSILKRKPTGFVHFLVDMGNKRKRS